jgi:hypothetical protein
MGIIKTENLNLQTNVQKKGGLCKLHIWNIPNIY